MAFLNEAYWPIAIYGCVVPTACMRCWSLCHVNDANRPSRGARCMAQTAAHLVDRVIPSVPVRQWVLSFPISLRYLFASNPDLLSPVLQVIHRAL